MSQRRRDQRYGRGRTTPEPEPSQPAAPRTPQPPPTPQPAKATKKKTARKRRPAHWNSRSNKAELRKAARSRGIELEGGESNEDLRDLLYDWDEEHAE